MDVFLVTSLLASKTVQLNSARLQFALLVGITTVILTVVNVYCVSMQSGDLRYYSCLIVLFIKHE
jgi:hypothetical protein